MAKKKPKKEEKTFHIRLEESTYTKIHTRHVIKIDEETKEKYYYKWCLFNFAVE